MPLKSISIKSGDETASGIIDDAKKNVTFTFNRAEDFTNVDIIAEVNYGWTLTFPDKLQGVDLQNTPVLNFKDPNNAIVKYAIKFSSNAFPVVNPAKIQIEGLLEGENIKVDNTIKTIFIKYDQNKMNFNSVRIIFNAGALQEGVTVPDDLDFDFSEGNTQQIIFKLGGDRPYKITLDVSDYMKTSPEQLGFADVSADFNLSSKPFVQVYAADRLNSIPVAVTNESKYDPAWSGSAIMWLYGGENPRIWEGGIYEDTPTYSDDVWSLPGDWKMERPVINCFGKIMIVLIEAGKVKADLHAGSESVRVGDFSNLIVTTGWKKDAETDYMVMDKGVIVNKPSGEHQVAYRASIGVGANKLSFMTAAEKDGSLYSIPFQNETPDAEALVAAASEKWEVEDAAWVAAWGVRAGKSMGIWDLVNNDASQFVSDKGVLGMGWGHNFYNVHNLIGTTYDGKIALMINAPGNCNWDGVEGYENVDNAYQPMSDMGFNYRGYSLKQMLWLAQKLGWRDAAALGNTTNLAKEFMPVVKVNGKSLIPDAQFEDRKSSYVITIDAK